MDSQQPFILIALFAVMFLFFILPSIKRQKNEKKFAEGLKKGDRVITKSGLHARVFEIIDKQDAVVLETNAGKLTYDKSAISLEMSKKLNSSDSAKK